MTNNVICHSVKRAPAFFVACRPVAEGRLLRLGFGPEASCPGPAERAGMLLDVEPVTDGHPIIECPGNRNAKRLALGGPIDQPDMVTRRVLVMGDVALRDMHRDHARRP